MICEQRYSATFRLEQLRTRPVGQPHHDRASETNLTLLLDGKLPVPTEHCANVREKPSHHPNPRSSSAKSCQLAGFESCIYNRFYGVSTRSVYPLGAAMRDFS